MVLHTAHLKKSTHLPLEFSHSVYSEVKGSDRKTDPTIPDIFEWDFDIPLLALDNSSSKSR